MIKQSLQPDITVGIFAPVEKLQLNCFKKHLFETTVKLEDGIVQLRGDANIWRKMAIISKLREIDGNKIISNRDLNITPRQFFQLLYLQLGFLSVAQLTVANLAQFEISVHWQVSVRQQYLVRLLSQCWITGGHSIYPPIEGLLPPTGIEPTLFQNSASDRGDKNRY